MRSGGSIPLEKGRGGGRGRGYLDPNPDPKIKGGRSQKNLFLALRAQFGLNIRGALR